MITVRPATPDDTEVLAQLRFGLWPEGSVAVQRVELEELFRAQAAGRAGRGHAALVTIHADAPA